MPKPKHEQMDFEGLEIVADEFTGAVVSDSVTVEAYVAGGITAGTLQEVLEALADRIDALENP